MSASSAPAADHRAGGGPQRYAVAALAVALAAAAGWPLHAFLGGLGLFALPLVAVTAAARYGGLGPGLLGTALATLQGAVYCERFGNGPGIDRIEALEVAVAAALGVVITAFLESAQRSQRAAAQPQARAARLGDQAAESERRFQTVADDAPVLLWMCDSAGRCAWCNRTWLEFSGRPLAAERDQGWLATLHDDDRERWRTTLLEAVAERKAFRVEARRRRADGGWRWMLEHGVPRSDPGGRPRGLRRLERRHRRPPPRRGGP